MHLFFTWKGTIHDYFKKGYNITDHHSSRSSPPADRSAFYFLCRDSILAAPVCLDLCLLSDLAARAGRYGTQRFLSFFLKSPMHDYTKGEEAVNHLYRQHTILKNALREMGGYEADEEIE